MSVIRLKNPDRSDEASAGEIPGFDVLRALAILGVVALHAGVPYARHPMPGLVWPVSDSSSGIVDAIFWGIEVIIMPLFLMIAGFLTWRSSQRRSPGQLVKSRAKRLLIPLAFGVFIVLPSALYIWTMGLVAEGVVPVIKLKSLKFDPPVSEQIWGLSHLWFLLYLFLYVVVTACLLRLKSLQKMNRLTAAIARPKVLLILLGSIAVATLVAAPEVVWGFQHAFLPVPSKWIYCGVFFAAGCGLARHDLELKWAAGTTPQMLALGTVLLVTSVALGTWSLDQSERGGASHHAATCLLALLTVAAAGTTTIGLLGASIRYVRQVPRPVRYVASASFWIYLVHHPLLGLIHYDLKWLWPTGLPIVKLVVSFAAATGVSLLMFESFVHRSWLGSLLGLSHPGMEHSRKHRVDTSEVLTLPDVESETRRAA